MTDYIEIDVSFIYDADNGTPDRFEGFLDQVMDELAAIGIENADLSASLAAFTATFVLPTPDRSDDSLIKAVMDLRAALHASNCGTAGWPSRHEVLATRSVTAKELAEAI